MGVGRAEGARASSCISKKRMVVTAFVLCGLQALTFHSVQPSLSISEQRLWTGKHRDRPCDCGVRDDLGLLPKTAGTGSQAIV